MKNSVLSRSAAKIIDNGAPSQYVLTAHFISSDEGSKFSFYPLRIDNLTITRDYIANYADEIDLKMMISPKDYALMQDQGQNLLCVLTITYANKFGKIVYSPAPIRKQYHVMINDALDIRKSIPDVHLYTEPSTQLVVRLVEPTIYKLRHTRLNTVYQNTTVSEAIYAITHQLGITNIHLTPLDNTHKYDHIDLASYQGIDSIFGYLHSKCGLYTRGATSYVTDGVLYIYPPFETAPVYDRSAIFYQVTRGQYEGSSVFHKVENDSVSIVINTQPESYDLSVAAAENIGTGFIFSRASLLTDGLTSIDSKEGAKFAAQPSLNVTLNSARTTVKGMNNTFHVKATDNPFTAMSHLVSQQASLMQVEWKHADPFRLDPGHAVSYYYDMNGTMVRKTGIVENAVYQFSSMGKMDSKDLFGCMGQLTLRLSPNVSMTL